MALNYDLGPFDAETEYHNNEIDLPEDENGNFDFDDEGSDEENDKENLDFGGSNSEENPFRTQRNLSVIPENNENDSTVSKDARNQIASSVASNIQTNRNVPFDLTSVSTAKSVFDSTTGSNGRNFMNSTSFSTTKLAELDAKYQFSQNKNINRMDINEIMASVNLKGRPRYQKDASTTTNVDSFNFKKPSSVETLLQSKKNGTFQREPFANRHTFNNSIINDDGCNTGRETLKTARSASTIASANTSIVSDQVISRSCFISVDKPVLAFGFVGYKTSRSLTVKISNDSNESLWLQPLIIHSANDPKSNEIFKLTDQSSFSLDPYSNHDICVIFEPKKAITYNAQLRLRLMSKDEPEFLIRIFGYGGRSELELRTQNFDKIEMGSDGVGICEIDRSSKQTQIILTNKGQRDAFAHIIAVDANNQPLSGNVVIVEPCRVVVQKNTKEYVKINVSFRYGLGSTTMIKTRSTSQMSIASTHSTRTLHNEGLARLQIIWGEERLRRRLKCYLNNNTDENVPISLMEYVTNNFRGETQFNTEKIVGRWDLTRFSDSSRLMTVQFVDLHVRPQSSVATLSRPPSSASNHTLPNQTLANTMAASSVSQIYSMFSNATVDDDTMPIYNRRNNRYQ